MSANTKRYDSVVARYRGEGSAPVAGFDVITLDEQGRIRSVLGFLDRVPTGA